MKKLLNLLSLLTIGANTVPTVIAASDYQQQEQILSRNKRQGDIVSHMIEYNFSGKTVYSFHYMSGTKTVVNLNGASIEEVKSHFPNDTVFYDSTNNSSSTDTISNTVYHQGGKFTFKWKWYKVFYWTLEMDNKACEILTNYLNSIRGGIVGTGAGAFIAALASNMPGPLVAAAGVIPALNLYLIYELIENNNRGNGIWIGFWINQPGIGWGSL